MTDSFLCVAEKVRKKQLQNTTTRLCARSSQSIADTAATVSVWRGLFARSLHMSTKKRGEPRISWLNACVRFMLFYKPLMPARTCGVSIRIFPNFALASGASELKRSSA